MTLTSKQIKRISKFSTTREASFDSDESIVDELVLYAENDGELYTRFYEPIAANMAKFYEKGNYDQERAIQGWMYFVDAVAKKYSQDFGGVWHQSFPKNIRQMAAAEIAQQWLTEYELQRENEGSEDMHTEGRRFVSQAGPSGQAETDRMLFYVGGDYGSEDYDKFRLLVDELRSDDLHVSTVALADALKEHMGDLTERHGSGLPMVLSDLLNLAVSEIRWDTVASYMLDGE